MWYRYLYLSFKFKKQCHTDLNSNNSIFLNVRPVKKNTKASG